MAIKNKGLTFSQLISSPNKLNVHPRVDGGMETKEMDLRKYIFLAGKILYRVLILMVPTPLVGFIATSIGE